MDRRGDLKYHHTTTEDKGGERPYKYCTLNVHLHFTTFEDKNSILLKRLTELNKKTIGTVIDMSVTFNADCFELTSILFNDSVSINM